MPSASPQSRPYPAFRWPARVLAVLLTVLACLGWAGVSLAQPDINKKKILYLNSYHNGYAWSDQILQGLRDALDKSTLPYDLQIEYMDSKRFYGTSMSDTLATLYREKYQGVTFDVLIASDDNAYQFLLEHQPSLFPETPVVFCGVNDYDPATLRGHSNFTGVVETTDISANLQLAHRLSPEITRVIVVSDMSLTGQAIRKQVQRAAARVSKLFAFEYWEVHTLPELLEKTDALSPSDMIFLIPIYLGSGKQVFSVEEVCEIVSRRSPVPIYSAWQFMLGHGIVGGKLHSGQGEGQIAGNMALRILSGESPANIPVVDKFDDPYLFDYLALKRFKIPEDALPLGSTLINEPLTFYTINKQVVWVGLVGFFLLVFILVLLITSIVQKRSVELQIKNQLSFLHILMDTIPLPLSYKGVDGSFLGCNLAFEKWFGVARGDLLKNLQHPLARRHDAAERHLLRVPGVLSYETDMQDSAGATHGVIVSKATYLSAKGEVAGVVEAIQDITLRREAEKALRRSQAMLRTVLDNIPQLVYWKDRDLNFMGVNRSFVDFFGLDNAQSIVGRRVGAIMPLEASDSAEKVNRRVLASGHSVHRREWTIELPGRDPVTLEMTVVPLHDETGEIMGILGTAEDVTAKLSLERQLLQSQKMEAIGALAGGIAHDFNNILTSIINSTELALMDLAEDSETAQDMERSLKAARRGSRLVQQILAFSRPSQQGFAPTDMAEVVHEALAIFAATLPRNITLSENIQVNPAIAFADPTQVHQIVMNICANAFQAMRDTGGHLALELVEADLDETHAEMVNVQPGRYLRLAVSDSGPGIPPDIMDRIFDPFFTTKAKGEGTGLGLAVVHGIVKSHRGGLRVASQPGKGTTFEIYLPKQGDFDASFPRALIAAKAAARRGDERILFVEDDADQLTVIPRVLSLLGYEVTAVSGAQEALDAVTALPGAFDVVVTDFDMPALSGVELAQRIEDIAPNLPVILVSGRRSALTAAQHAGNIRTVLLKPYNGEELAGAIGLLLDENQA
ncbi:Sensor kinase CckA [Fundidesulfovibrio magnetotacticus]|uniref:histidine kinase n=1 Tax=Fundidesulfovibrio magnetotacticus TaxID=2730080 RepID=A0A6V8M024_9BACT|nr:ATP-binding protein [Fundidesulfovibrio magnetotacticus]GFK95818.1 Sensor kinase CckA [Fundidesulfovibrio magnetotacticus]